jgi:adenylate kinase
VADRAFGPRIVVLGRQGSGKGTQATRLASKYAVPHVSTGEAFRAAVKEGTELGRTVQGYMDRGDLVPDEVVEAVIKAHLFGPRAPAGFVLDGFPRNVAQAEALELMAGPRGLDVVLNLEASKDEVLRRIAGRRVCSACGANYNVVDHPPRSAGVCDACGSALHQRDDDTEEAVSRRLELYEAVTAPLIDWYRQRGLLANVDAMGSPEEVGSRALDAVEAARDRR